jgi:hypothetical protein
VAAADAWTVEAPADLRCYRQSTARTERVAVDRAFLAEAADGEEAHLAREVRTLASAEADGAVAVHTGLVLPRVGARQTLGDAAEGTTHPAAEAAGVGEEVR